MAELAALQVAASIIQVIDVGIRVIKRLQDFKKKANGLPDAFKHINLRLPLFVDALRQTNAALEDMTDTTRKAFRPAIEECLVQIRKLETTIEIVLPKESDRGFTRGWKALISVKSESDIKDMNRIIKEYMELMAQHQTSSLALRQSTGHRAPVIPVSTCPFPRDRSFIERDVMDELMFRCQPGSRLALTGIGGVGKSQIAIELTYRVRKAALQTWVVWVDAKDQASFEASYRKFAKAVQLPGWDEQNTDVLTLVHDWLNDETNGPWIMVLDSVDDTNTLTAPVRDSKKMSNGLEPLLLPQIREFIPISQKGSILATSTNVDAAQLITGNCADHIDVGEMSEDEALALLKSKLHRKVIYTDDDARELVKAAEYMPLAISQLAARISIEFPRLTLSQATDKLNNPDQDATRLLEGSAHELNRDVRRTNSVVKSWHLSFQYVREKSPSAARLLSLMCLFDRQGISETLLVGEYGEEVIASTQPHLPWWNRIRKRALHKRKRIAAREDATSVKKHNFDADWRILNSLMLVKTSIGGHHFNMHRLVQYTTRRWLEVHGELEAWMKKYVMILRSYFPLPDYQHFEESHFKDSHFEACQYLFPHTQHVASYRPTDLATLRRWASLLLDISLFAHHQGNNTAAEKLGRVALAMLDELVEERNKYTLRCLNQLGVALQALNKYQEAESLLRRAWKGREALLGPDHLDTIDSAYRLGDVLNVQQKWDEGEAIEMQVLEGCGRVYGATHIDTLSLMSRMAFGCIVNGRYKQAERLHRRVFEIRRTASGEQSEQAYQYMQGLARLLNMQGEAAEAEVLQQQVVKAGEARSGLHYSGTIQSINLLGEVLIKRGKFEEAAALLNRVLEIYADLNVQAREQACFCLNNLAEVYLQQGKLSEAECVGRNLIEQWETLLGSDHVDTLVGVHTLADILTQQERFEDALELYERAYRGTEQRCGAEHSDTVRFLNDFNTAKIRALAWPVLNIRDSLESNKTTELVFLPPMLTASQSSALIMA